MKPSDIKYSEETYDDMRERRKRLIPEELKKIADEIGVEIQLGEQGPIFTGPETLVKEIQDYYDSITSTDPTNNNISAYDAVMEEIDKIGIPEYEGIHSKLLHKDIYQTGIELDDLLDNKHLETQQDIAEREMNGQLAIDREQRIKEIEEEEEVLVRGLRNFI